MGQSWVKRAIGLTAGLLESNFCVKGFDRDGLRRLREGLGTDGLEWAIQGQLRPQMSFRFAQLFVQLFRLEAQHIREGADPSPD